MGFKTRRKVSRQFLEPFCSRVLGGLREVPTIARGLRSALPLLTCAATIGDVRAEIIGEVRV